jgi:hypothetical protein
MTQNVIDAVRIPRAGQDHHVLLVGEANPYGADPRYALYNEPEHSAGGRLQRKIAGLSQRDYLSLWRTNLCIDGWGLVKARRRADQLLVGPFGADAPQWRPWDVVVLLGRKVAGAFEDVAGAVCDGKPRIDLPPWHQRTVLVHGLPIVLAAIPHPSGLNRDWNDRDAFHRARRLLEWVAPDVPWGSLHGEHHPKHDREVVA